ncbi:MAG: porphyrin biosynthesis protein [Stutzerimonas stutzeri]|nr:MAG: porphyrin biosynthesis protein [Stutzerimonas stutzeri]
MTDVIDQATSHPGEVDGKILCQIDNQRVHSIQGHIKKAGLDAPEKGGWSIEKYEREFPGAPKFSQYMLAAIKKREEELAAAKAAPQSSAPAMFQQSASTNQSWRSTTELTSGERMFHELFELGNAKGAMSSRGLPIPVRVMSGHDDLALTYLPDVDKRYVFNIDLLKKVIVGLELNKPIYLWGYHGTGKTTILEQACAYTRRPFIRKQHTINMQESDVLGQWTVRDGNTEFQLGPLPMAMINGWVYCADEYDFAMPSVTAVYQPVLEGKALLISDAPSMFRKIVPHPNFRFVATGNTNGVGDETGLYQGTLVQNAANYSRFGITEEVTYMSASEEISVLVSRCAIDKVNAGKIVKLANEVRKMFREGQITMTVSPRELINAVELGIAFQANWDLGLKLAFANRLSRVDRKVVGDYSQRLFGTAAVTDE